MASPFEESEPRWAYGYDPYQKTFSAVDTSEESETKQNPLIVRAIKTKKNSDAHKCFFDEVFKPPFVLSICGAPGTGKTNLLVHLINNLWAHYFHRIVVFSGSAKLDDMWEQARIPSADKVAKWDDEEADKLDQLLQSQGEIVKTLGIESTPRLLIIIDDFATKHSIMHDKRLVKLGTNGRHVNASIVFSTQVWRRVDPNIRKSCSNCIVFSTGNAEEFETLCAELSQPGLLTKRQFKELYNHATLEKHSFLHFNRRAKDPLKCYSRCLDQNYVLPHPSENDELRGRGRTRKRGHNLISKDVASESSVVRLGGSPGSADVAVDGSAASDAGLDLGAKRKRSPNVASTNA